MATSRKTTPPAVANTAPAAVPDSQTALTIPYKVDGSNNPVTFSISFGPPGVGVTTSAKLGATLLINGQVGSITKQVVGNNQALAGQFLTIYSNVMVSDQVHLPTNLSVNFSMSGGVQSYSHPMTPPATVAGSTFLFRIEVFFFT